jgi:hypothetical protein
MATNKGSLNSCCGEGLVIIKDHMSSFNQPPVETNWSRGIIDIPEGKVVRVATELKCKDMLGSWKARWAINRMRYTVLPGLYGVGNPDDKSPVLVTANYKMSFDRLRKELTGLNAWIMVLDTKGINVWCAAGKGTFGTAELINRIRIVGLSRVVSHHTIVLPQLGAPGVAAHEVRKQTEFSVVYGPVRASDIKDFLNADMKATRAMREITFGFLDRLVLSPVELVLAWKPTAIAASVIVIAALIGIMDVSFAGVFPFITAILIGTIVAPALLPWIPGRAFSWKGWLLGFIWAMAVVCMNMNSVQPWDIWNNLALLLLLPAISAYLTMNFTGTSTYTSLSGVKKEMRIAVPVIIILALAGIASWIIGRI